MLPSLAVYGLTVLCVCLLYLFIFSVFCSPHMIGQIKVSVLDTMGLVVGWLCNCLSKTCKIEAFQLKYTFFIMTLDFCFESSVDCILLLDPETKNLDGALAFFWSFFFNLRGELSLNLAIVLNLQLFY